MITFFLTTALAIAGFREPGEERGPRPRQCREEMVLSCVREQENFRAGSTREVAALDEKILLISRDKSEISQQQGAFLVEENSEAITEKLSLAEIDDSLDDHAVFLPIFDHGPSPNKIFLLENGPEFWTELNRGERTAKLKALAERSSIKVQHLQPILRKLAMEISGLDTELAALSSTKTGHLQAISRHGYMCQSGCREQICPEI